MNQRTRTNHRTARSRERESLRASARIHDIQSRTTRTSARFTDEKIRRSSNPSHGVSERGLSSTRRANGASCPSVSERRTISKRDAKPNPSKRTRKVVDDPDGLNATRDSFRMGISPSIVEKNMSDHVWSRSNQNSRRSGFVASTNSKFSRKHAESLPVFSKTMSHSRKDARSSNPRTSRTTAPAPKRISRFPKRIATIVLAALIISIGGYGVDSLINGDKIYQGITIGEVNVGGLTKDQAIEQVSGYYSPRVSENVPTFYATEQAQSDPEKASDAANIEEQLSYEESLETRTQWTLPSSTLDATFNVDDAVNEAFMTGRENGGIIARIQAAINGWNLEPYCSFNETSLTETLKEMTTVVGTERVNYDIEINDEGVASVTQGHDGNEVIRDWLVSRLNETYFGDQNQTSYVLETTYMPLQITEELATVCANKVNASIAQGALFTYEDQTWDASRADLASLIITSIDPNGDSWVLTPMVDESKAKKTILGSFKSNIDLDNIQVSFSKDEQGGIIVSSNATGTVPLVSDAVKAMNETFFVEESRTDTPTIAVSSTDLPSTLSFDDAVTFGLIEEVSSFTTQYSSGAEARTNNIHTAADLLNNSIIAANGGTWSFNDTAGEATEDKGYQNAGAIVGGEYSDAIGGGICQVATTVFNAIYDAGYPITERHNHTLRIESYPEGRDAAIAYPYMDLIWQNDSTSDVLLVMTYTNSSVTCTLWGIDPGYQVSTEYGEWQEGEPYSIRYTTDDTIAEGTEYVETTGVNGSSITITRTVKDKEGTVLHEDVFESNYSPKDEVIVKGSA